MLEVDGETEEEGEGEGHEEDGKGSYLRRCRAALEESDLAWIPNLLAPVYASRSWIPN